MDFELDEDSYMFSLTHIYVNVLVQRQGQVD